MLHILKRLSLFVRATRTEDQVNNTLLLSNSLVRAENVWDEWTRLIPPWKRASLSDRDRSIDPHNKPIFSYERGSNWPCALQASLYIFYVYVCVFAGASVCVWSGRIFAKSLFIEVGQAFTWQFGGELQQGGLWTRGLRVREQKVNGRLIYERPPDRTEFSHPFRQILSSSNRPRLAPRLVPPAR